MINQLETLESYSLEVLKAYAHNFEGDDQIMTGLSLLNKEELLDRLYDFFTWNEFEAIPSVEHTVCLECVAHREQEIVEEYVKYNYNCTQCSHSMEFNIN